MEGFPNSIFSLPISIITIIIIIFFFFQPCNSLSIDLQNNFTLYGEASFLKDAISLTQDRNLLQPSSFNGVGRALYKYPIRFLDPSTNSTASFCSWFSFKITTTPLSLSADGITFLITPNVASIGNYSGYLGLPNDMIDPQGSFVAVEFDTNFDPILGDINDNHVGIDLGSVVSFVSVGLDSLGINLKNGKHIISWIDYEDQRKMMSVWVSSEQLKPREPVISTPIDLSKKVLKEFMLIGFTGSNGRFGSAHQVVDNWYFRIFGLLASGIPNFEDEDGGSGDGGHPGGFMCNEGTQTEPFDVQDRFDNVGTTRKRSMLDEAALGMGAGVILLIITTLLVVWIRRKGYGKRGGHSGNCCIGKAFPARLSLAEIKSASKGFHRSKIIGEGASGVVYEGSLASGKEVAIKRFSQASKVDPVSNPFEQEIAAVVGCLKHKNLVHLVGWCCEGDELVLVYDFMPNGSLDRFLHFNKATNRTSFFLNWERRRKIVLGVASALTYLHEECETQIIHRDVKACNIMLDGEYIAVLGDFGLAELYEWKFSCSARTATIPAGMMGYLAPEYVHTGIPTEKTDVYSFGAVVLEVATGRRPVEIDGFILVDKVWEIWSKGKLMEVVDSRLLGAFEKREMERNLMVGLACLHPGRMRPNMNQSAQISLSYTSSSGSAKSWSYVSRASASSDHWRCTSYSQQDDEDICKHNREAEEDRKRGEEFERRAYEEEIRFLAKVYLQSRMVLHLFLRKPEFQNIAQFQAFFRQVATPNPDLYIIFRFCVQGKVIYDIPTEYSMLRFRKWPVVVQVYERCFCYGVSPRHPVPFVFEDEFTVLQEDE